MKQQCLMAAKWQLMAVITDTEPFTGLCTNASIIDTLSS